MSIKRCFVILASAVLILGLGSLVAVHATASAQGVPTIKLSGGTPKPCSIKKGTIINGCSIHMRGTGWPRTSVVDVLECNANVVTGDPHACDSTRVAQRTVGHSGRFSVNAFTIVFGNIGDGSCTALSSPSRCYIQAGVVQLGGGGETARASFTVPAAGKTIFSDYFSGTSVDSNWTVIDRHGEYAQAETECNVPDAVSVANNILSITTTAQSATCGDFNLDGSVRTAPTQWPYTTGDVQWKSFNFTFGTVTYRAKFPAQATGTWPAVWFLGSNCQATNPETADTGYASCPQIEKPGSGYREIDTTECYQSQWCQLALAQPSSFPVCLYPVDTNWHTYSLIWTATSITMTMDGRSTGCTFSSSKGYAIPHEPMFMLIQTQTGGAGGTPDDAQLPAVLQVSDITVTQP
ncbi:MAG TPA: hypothetical protein VII76_05195 [Acidimicrobiales bacterium]